MIRFSRPDQVVLVGSVVAGTHERAGFDVVEPHRQGFLFELLELLRRNVALDRQVLTGRTQVLAQGQNVDAGRAQLAHDSADFVRGLAKPEHEAALG